MNKDKFIECGYLMSSAYEEYVDSLRTIQDTYLKKLNCLDKKFKTKIFTKDAIEEMRYLMLVHDSQIAAESYLDDDTNIYFQLVQFFICDQEEIHNVRLFN